MGLIAICMYVLLGLAAGSLSGLIGIGGGVIIVPALVFLFGMSQHSAQGTTLALMVPPIGLFAAMAYYKQGYVDLRIAGLVCLGFIIGGLIGAHFSLSIPDALLRKIFGVAMLLISVKMIFS